MAKKEIAVGICILMFLIGIMAGLVMGEGAAAGRQLSFGDFDIGEEYTFVSEDMLDGKPYLSLRDSKGIVKSYEVPSEKVPQNLTAGDVVAKTKEENLSIVSKAKG